MNNYVHVCYKLKKKQEIGYLFNFLKDHYKFSNDLLEYLYYIYDHIETNKKLFKMYCIHNEGKPGINILQLDSDYDKVFIDNATLEVFSIKEFIKCISKEIS